MKKLISIILSALIVFSAAFCAFAAKPDPVILISGFMCSRLYTDFGTPEQKRVWGPSASDFAGQIKKDFPNFVSSFGDFLGGDAESFGKTLGYGAAEVLETLKCNPDGSSEYAVEHYPNIPEKSNVEYMLSADDGEYLYEKNFCKYMAEKIGGNRVFCFQYDSRLDAAELAAELRTFIKDVKKYTGSEKVSLVALSYGGLITSTYLTLYGSENDVGRAVMSVPALGGTNIPSKILHGDITVSKEAVFRFIETALGGSGSMADFFEKDRIKWLDELADGLSAGLSGTVKNWGSFWCLCSQEDYDALKAEFLDSVENEELIGKADYIHYEVMPELRNTFEACRRNGMKISIICGTGNALCLGGSLNGDVILPASGVSGAACAPLGSRFADGYTGIKTVCDNPAHNHISPSMEIDASSAYLPENTWFVESHYHGQYYYEDYTRSLVTKLLIGDEIEDIYSDPGYPQFADSNNNYRSLAVKFNSSGNSCLSSRDTALLVKNVSDDDYIKVLSITANNIKIDFDALGSKLIAPGEEIEIPFNGKPENIGLSARKITVRFIRFGTLNPYRSMDFDVMLDNGKTPEYDEKTVRYDSLSLVKNSVSERFHRFFDRFSLEFIYDKFVSKLS